MLTFKSNIQTVIPTVVDTKMEIKMEKEYIITLKIILNTKVNGETI